jgi:hypothetical protein
VMRGRWPVEREVRQILMNFAAARTDVAHW